MADITVHLHGKVIGFISGNTFRKNIREDEHLLKEPPAIAYDDSVIRGLKAHGVTQLMVHSDKQRDFFASLETLEAKGIKINRGFGEQTALPIDHWHIQKEANRDQDACLEVLPPDPAVPRPSDPERQDFLL